MPFPFRRSIIASLAGLLFAGAAFAGAPYDRQGWMAGLGFGLGRGETTDSNGSVSVWKEGMTPQIRFGKMLGRRFLVSYEQQMWFREQGTGVYAPNENEIRVRPNLQIFGLGITWYPGNLNNAWGGLFFQGAVGPAHAGWTVVTSEPEDPASEDIQRRIDEFGVGASLGAGYEFMVGRHFAPGVEVTARYFSIDEVFYDTAWLATLGLHLSYYF